MVLRKDRSYKFVLFIIAITVLAMGIIVFLIPPALFPDPSMGFQALRSMHLGAPFNSIVAPDQGNIANSYTQFLTWWSPGQYLVPWLFKIITGVSLGKAVAITVAIAAFCGLAGFYCFFTKVGFTQNIAILSLVFIICQLAFMVPYVNYNGGEVLLFAFEGWFLFGCIALKKADLKLVLFIVLSGFAGFFFKSSFLWMYAAGMFCLWLRLSEYKGIAVFLKNALWIGLPAAFSLAFIYFFYISKGETPATAASGFKLTAATFSYPLASPILAGFSVDDFFNGLIQHTGQPLINEQWSLIVLIVIALLSILLIIAIIRKVNNKLYTLPLIVFYVTALLFFGSSYSRQMEVSMESRHFRIIGLLIVPGIIYWASGFKPAYRFLFILVVGAIGFNSFRYLVKGYGINNSLARGTTGVAQPNIDQHSLNEIMQLDRENDNATFVFVGDDLGLEILHNRVISLPPIGDDLQINIDDYKYAGHAGPLYIVLPESYNGPREKMILKSFPGYKGFYVSMLSDNYVLYAAK
jgi:hypothetical protein